MFSRNGFRLNLKEIIDAIGGDDVLETLAVDELIDASTAPDGPPDFLINLYPELAGWGKKLT